MPEVCRNCAQWRLMPLLTDQTLNCRVCCNGGGPSSYCRTGYCSVLTSTIHRLVCLILLSLSIHRSQLRYDCVPQCVAAIITCTNVRSFFCHCTTNQCKACVRKAVQCSEHLVTIHFARRFIPRFILQSVAKYRLLPPGAINYCCQATVNPLSGQLSPNYL